MTGAAAVYEWRNNNVTEFDRLVLGSTTDRVIRKACSPVLAVSSPAHNLMTTGPDGKHRLGRIFYCTDFPAIRDGLCNMRFLWRRSMVRN